MLARTARPLASQFSPLASRMHAGRAITTAPRDADARRPAWLTRILEDPFSPVPKLYAWTPETLGLSGSSSAAASRSSRGGQEDASRRVYILGLGNLGRMYALFLRQRADPPPITLVVHRKELLRQWHESRGIEITHGGAQGQVQTCKDFDIEWWTTEKPPFAAAAAAAAADEGGGGGQGDGLDGQGTPSALEVAAADGGKIRNLLVTTKASVALSQVDSLRRYLDADTTVAFAQNGVSRLWPPHGDAYIAARFSNYRHGFAALLCVTTHGLYSTGAFSSVFAAPGNVSVGPILLWNQMMMMRRKRTTTTTAAAAEVASSSSSSYLEQLLTSTPTLEARAVTSCEIWALQLEKLVVNSYINPLTAILRCRNGELLGSGGLQTDRAPLMGRVMDAMLRASVSVLQVLVTHWINRPILATGHRQVEGAGGDEDKDKDMSNNRRVQAIQTYLMKRFTAESLREIVYGAVVCTGANKSSMLQDVEAGKATEIREINGWLVDMVARLGRRREMAVIHKKVMDLVERRVVMNKTELAGYLLGEEEVYGAEREETSQDVVRTTQHRLQRLQRLEAKDEGQRRRWR